MKMGDGRRRGKAHVGGYTTGKLLKEEEQIERGCTTRMSKQSEEKEWEEEETWEVVDRCTPATTPRKNFRVSERYNTKITPYTTIIHPRP